MKKNIKYIDKGTVNVGQDRPILTRVFQVQTAVSVRNAQNPSLVCFIMIFFHYRKSCERVIQVLKNNKSQCNRRLHFGFCIYPELFKFGYGESMARCVRRLEKLYFTVEDFIAFSAYVVCKHKSLCPLFYEDTYNEMKTIQGSSGHKMHTDAYTFPAFQWGVTQVLSVVSHWVTFRIFCLFWTIILYP